METMIIHPLWGFASIKLVNLYEAFRIWHAISLQSVSAAVSVIAIVSNNAVRNTYTF